VGDWLPTSAKEVAARGWEQPDVILFSGDAYVDHPSFGAAVVGRLLESLGLKVALVPQPNWRDDRRDFTKLGVPRLFFAVSGGAMDSMVNHYTANKRLRSDDAYSPGGQAGFRPDRCVTVYSRILKQLYPEVPLVIGGIEASLRRLSHYDYWDDALMPSILADAGADLLVYGMGEAPLEEMVRLLKKGVPFAQLRTVRQTAFLAPSPQALPRVAGFEDLQLESHEACVKDRPRYGELFRVFEAESNRESHRRLIQPLGDGRLVVVNPAFPLAKTRDLDRWYALPFTRLPHPRYAGKSLPAWEMIRDSVTLHRGCWGGCSFCAIAAHQGRHIASRSRQSILAEAAATAAVAGFGGQLSDLGGPSANMWAMGPKNPEICRKCPRLSCTHPGVCPNLAIDHAPLLELYRAVRALPGIKKAVVSSGIRYDLLFDRSGQPTADGLAYLAAVVANHVSGRLKVAPEHSEAGVLELMRKPGFELFRQFAALFEAENRRQGSKQELIPYFISSHPGCSAVDMARLAIETKSLHFQLEQVQDLTPTPLTLASAIWYTGRHPETGLPVPVERSPEGKRLQKLFFFWYKPENRPAIEAALRRLGRGDLARELFAPAPRKAAGAGPAAPKPHKPKPPKPRQGH
jgi:uncharacterized radical SAM protein YgiQ